ncbi:hypothetical protein ABK040_013846 [Willaertia magna]
MFKRVNPLVNQVIKKCIIVQCKNNNCYKSILVNNNKVSHFSKQLNKLLDTNLSSNKIRFMYSKECEQLVNEQITAELSASYNYTALAAYYHQPTVALHGVGNYFEKQSNEERSHAYELIKYQNSRGGSAQFSSLNAPPDYYSKLSNAPATMFNNVQDGKTAATLGFELAIEMERSVYEKIQHLYQLAETQKDFSLTGFLQHFIDEQVKSLHELQELYTKSKRIR